MRIAYIVPSLDSKAPVLLVKRLSDYFVSNGHGVKVFYFDNLVNVNFNCATEQIGMDKPINFDDFNIVHSHMMRPDKYVAKYSNDIVHAKTVSTIHCDISMDLAFSYGKLVSFVYTRLWLNWLKKIDITVQINDCLLALYKDFLPQSILIYNGVSLSKEKDDYTDIEKKIEYYHSKGYNVLCSYSILVARKGLFQILHLLKKRNDLAYICIGDGDQKRRLEEFVANNNLSERVTFFGFRRNPYNVMTYADVFVMSSYSEAFGLSLLEAGLVGSAVVCSSIPVFNLLYSNKEVSFFELDNIESLSTAVSSSIANKEIYKKNLYKKITTNFSEENMFHNYEALYNELITKRISEQAV